MSSGSNRETQTGVIRQGKKVVGTICMPDATDVFIREFNHCYGQLRMEIEERNHPQSAPKNPHAFQLPTWFRHVWHTPVLAATSEEVPASQPEKLKAE